MPTINLGLKRQRNKTYNKDIFQHIYQDKRWKKLRAVKFANNPLCEVCLKDGRVRLADEVHHIVPFYNGVEALEWLAFDYDNLLSVCFECHDKIHKGRQH